MAIRPPIRSRSDWPYRIHHRPNGVVFKCCGFELPFAERYKMFFENQVFDISKEWPKYRDRYGDSDFGRGCLLARRLVEAGVPFVSMQVGLWDHHCDTNSGSIFKGYQSLLPLYDHCISALINDLHSRGVCSHCQRRDQRYGNIDDLFCHRRQSF